MRIGVLGTGTIATAVVRGIAGDGHQISVSERSAENSAALAAEFGNVTVADNQAVLDRSDVVFLGLMAEGVTEAEHLADDGFSAPGIRVDEAPFLGEVALGAGGGAVQLVAVERLLPQDLQERLFEDL